MARTQQDVEAALQLQGFRHVYTWTDKPDAYYQPASHPGRSIRVILRGQLTVAFPEDGVGGGDPARTTYCAGDQLDVPAGRVNEVWIGPEGCTYVIGA